MARALLFSRVGQWRAHFLWRFFGLVIYEFALLLVAGVYSWDLFTKFGLHYVFPASLLLIAFGSRLPVLAASAALVTACALPFFSKVVEWQIGEELILFMSLPAAGAILILLTRFDERRARSSQPAHALSFDDRVDAAHAALFRITAVVIMAFATLHKLNRDFFDLSVSCALELASELNSWWALPLSSITLKIRPMHVIVGEGLIPVLLLTYPRLGILACALVVGVIGQRGATAFSMLTFALSCAFLYERDGAKLKYGLQRYWAAVLVVLLIAAPISAKYFVPHRLWYEFHLFQVVILLVVLAASYLMVCDWQSFLKARNDERSVKSLLLPQRRHDGFSRASRGARAALIVFAVAALVNCLSPYLGLKYRLSMAMISNLRVDDNRWNSLIFPRWMYLRRHDPFVHVTHVKFEPRGTQLMEELEGKPTRGMYVGLFSPMSFKYRMKYVQFNATTFDVDLTYQGRPYSFRDALNDPQFTAWVAALPDGKMFQEGLVDEGPQPCTH